MSRLILRGITLMSVCVMLAAPALAQDAGGKLQKALDQTVELTVKGTIVEVLSRLSTETKVKLVVDKDTLRYLPYGDQTEFSVKLKNVTLRKALTRVLVPQALKWEIRTDIVHIVPTDALRRMVRRATHKELELLGIIYDKELKPVTEGADVIEQLRQLSGNKDLDFAFHVDIEKRAMKRADQMLPGTGAEWLDMLCHGKDRVWYPYGDRIIVMDKKLQIKRQVQKHVSLRYERAELVQILRDLARLAAIKLTMEAGVMEYLPLQTRTNFALVISDASVDQVLQVISGETGLEFKITNEGINVGASAKLKKESRQASRPRSPFYLRMTIPGADGTDIEIIFRTDDLPEELVKAILSEREKLIQRLSEKYLPKSKSKPEPKPEQ